MSDSTRITFSGKHTIFNCVDIVLSEDLVEKMKEFVESGQDARLIIEPGVSDSYDAIRMIRMYKGYKA